LDPKFFLVGISRVVEKRDASATLKKRESRGTRAADEAAAAAGAGELKSSYENVLGKS